MENSFWSWPVSPWYLVVCLVVALGYATILYRGDKFFSLGIKRLLFGLRTLFVFLVAALLINPQILLIKSERDEPMLILAVDNSTSIVDGVGKETVNNTLLPKLWLLQSKLQDNGIAVKVHSFNGAVANKDSLKFSYNKSPLDGLIKKSLLDNEGYNVGGVILVSDGLVNTGLNPVYGRYQLPIHTIAIGDTVGKRDIWLKSIEHNSVAFSGNMFPIKAQFSNRGFTGKQISIVLKQGNNVLEKKPLTLGGKESLQEVTFLVKAAGNGQQRYRVEIEPLEGEFQITNNNREAFIEITEGRERILLYAAAPHPDLKAIRAAIESTQQYDFQQYVVGVDEWKEQPYDAVIFHQVPNVMGQGKDFLDKVMEKKIPAFFIGGQQTNWRMLSGIQSVIQVSGSGLTDAVSPAFNSAFNRINYEVTNQEVITMLPPLVVPFGEPKLGAAEVILFQRVGSLVTNKPLLVYGESNGQKIAVLTGEGIWQWRIQEFADKGNWNATDELLRKVIGLISAKDDKRKFRFQPLQRQYEEGEEVRFQAEFYNDLMEPVFGKTVTLELKPSEGKTNSFNFSTSEGGNTFSVGALVEGVYKYQARGEVNGKVEIITGDFSVKSLQLEAAETKADFELMRNVAAESGGFFANLNSIEALADSILQRKPKAIVRSFEERSDAITMPWLLVFIILLAGAEWLIRKYQGAI